MIVTLKQGIFKNGQYHKEITFTPVTIGMEEEALDMCITLGKGGNLISAEICSIAVATGYTYDDIRALNAYDYNLLRKAYTSFLTTPPQVKEDTNLMPEQA